MSTPSDPTPDRGAVPEPGPLSPQGPLGHRPGQEREHIRAFSEPGKRRRRDVDSFERAVRIRILLAAPVGGLLGGLLGFLGEVRGLWPPWMAVVLVVVGTVGMYVIVMTVIGSSGRLASTLYNPSGASTPRKREYSQAEALAIREDHQGAIDAFELAILEDSADPVPYVRIARIYRDGLKRFEEAAVWFKRALDRSVIPPGLAILTQRELIELYAVRMGEPERAAPILARMAEELEGTEEGAWAADELVRVKKVIAEKSGLA